MPNSSAIFSRLLLFCVRVCVLQFRIFFSLLAVEVQESWARSLGVNLLASNYHQPNRGHLGSGIYGPNGHISYSADPVSGTSLLIARVSKDSDDLAPPVVETPTSHLLNKVEQLMIGL